MTYEECVNAAREGKPVKSWYIDGAVRVEHVYQRIVRVGVNFIEKNGELIPSEYVELLSPGGGSVTNSGPERCSLATEEELKSVIDKQNSDWYRRVIFDRGREAPAGK